ncbi:hypothetical protein ABEP17_12950 [Priestia flexa]|uniref:Uncharacterized protein n=1 Tax=Priestia flexa TaxID=86664 RepID=A0ABU4J8F0_9BACI|nr:hypothetical protein [Priestia flexa]AQX54780.1 hypothetical protein BC359_11010 [Priestia flexa]MBY6088153.1 hypothetical protein [Priestia flexa]MCA1202038.1 hypothetical protein [Priestia flexa]MCG7315213.1 hypothetical protein [Priestia flexa]MCP1189412.1 hypothetical protein [Priestia flexa]
MKNRDNVIPFTPKKNPSHYSPASVKLDKKLVEFLEIMDFDDRNDFLNEMIDSFFQYVKSEEDEVQ